MFLTVVFLIDVEKETKETTSQIIIGIIFLVLFGNLILSLLKSI